MAWSKEGKKKEIIVRADYRKDRQGPTNKTNLKSFQHKRAIKQRVFCKASKETWSYFMM